MNTAKTPGPTGIPACTFRYLRSVIQTESREIGIAHVKSTPSGELNSFQLRKNSLPSSGLSMSMAPSWHVSWQQ
jgi:hypothetical protein